MPSDKKNSLWLSIQYVIALVFSLITLKLNISHFGKELFGIFLLFRSIWGLSALFDFGFGTSIIKYVAEYKNDVEKVNKILSSSFIVFIAIGFIMFFAGNIGVYLIYLTNENIINNQSFLSFFTISIILGFSFLMQYFGFFFKSIIDGISNFTFTSRILILRSTLLLFGVILIFIIKLPLIYLAILQFFVTLIILINYLVYFLLNMNQYRISLSGFDKEEVRKVIKFSFSVQLMTAFNALIDPLIKYLLGVYYELGSVSVYEIARRFSIAISGLYFNAFKIILPKASSLSNFEEQIGFLRNDIIKYCRLGITYSGFMFGVLALPLAVFMKTVFDFEEVLLMFVILSLPEAINNFGYPIYNYLLGNGRVRLLVLIQFNNLIFVAIGMTFGLIVFQSVLGLLGYFVSVLIANILMLVYLKRNWGVFAIKEFIEINIHKLVGLVILLIIGSIFLYNEVASINAIFTSISIISLIIFAKDIKELFIRIILPMIKNKFLV